MKKLFSLILFFTLFSASFCFSQNEVKKWYFGFNAALDFMPGAPINLLGSALSHLEGSSSIADAAGNLLFYSDGITVWDRNHTPMPNGTGLLGGVSSTHPALIVKQPGNANIYYVFTTGAWGPGPANYSIVDITLNGGFGDVTTKNTQLLSNCSEKIAATKHCNGTDIWIVYHERTGTNYHSYLLTATGLNPSIQSSVGTSYLSNLGYGGQLKFSPNGTKLAAGINSNGFELYDFNKTTGIISNAIVLGAPIPASYGVEFSPDNSKVYGYNTTQAGAVTTLRQWDVCAGNAAAITASGIVVANPTSIEAGALQLATDGKIYVCRFSNMLGVINNPNAAGLACNYSNTGVSIAPNSSADGLPSFVSSYFDLDIPFATPSQTNATACQNNASATATITNGCSGPYTYTWSNSTVTGPTAATSDSITNLAPGNYNVIVTDAACKKDTLYFIITGSSNIQTNQSPIICLGNTFTLPDNSIVSSPGIYIDTVVSFNGCDSIVTTTLTVNTQPSTSISPSTTISAGQSTAILATGGNSYNWSPSTGLNTTTGNTVIATPAQTTIYCVIITDANGCSDTLCVTISIETPCPDKVNLNIPNAFSPNNDLENDEFCLQGWDNCIENFSIFIFNRWGEKVFESKDPNFCWDGKHNGTVMDAQVCVYYIKAKYSDTNKAITKKGNISLIK